MPNAYQVLDWNRHFENNKSRERDRCGFVCVPNKQDGLGLTRILAKPDGAMIYGIWCLIIGALSRQCRPRAGWLTVDGHPAGTPWAPGDLAIRWRRDVKEIERALEVLTSEEVSWMTGPECPPSARRVPVRCPGREGKGREEKGKEENTDCTEPAEQASVLNLPLIPRDGQFGITQEMVDEWTEAFPGVDVLRELRVACQWAKDNPARRKTSRGARKFLGGWLGRAQDRGRYGQATKFQGDEEIDFDMFLKKAEEGERILRGEVGEA